jgi:hypothetical protein
MAPPKKAFFSLNVDSQIESLPPPRVTHHSSEDSFGKKVVEVSGPVQGSSRIEIVKQKGDGKVHRHVEGFGIGDHGPDHQGEDTGPEGAGQGIKEGLSFTTESAKTATKDPPSVHTTIVKTDTRPVEDLYDTSEL